MSFNTAHIFPAFIPEYLGIETREIGEDRLYQKLKQASGVVGRNLWDFDIENNNYLDNPLISQYIPYIMSCCVSDILHEHQKIPSYVSAFSMGIYAALYHSKSVDFATGLKLILAAYYNIEHHLPEEKMGMCVIGGLNKDDISGQIHSFVDKVNIINQNSKYSFILSGHYQALLKILENAKADGAMQTRMLAVSHPYHSPILKKASEDFYFQIKELAIADSIFPIVSTINQKIITSKEDIILELVSNLFQSFHWWKTFDFMLSQNVDSFIECGAGESLYKVGKFIEGNFTIVNLKRMRKYLNE